MKKNAIFLQTFFYKIFFAGSSYVPPCVLLGIFSIYFLVYERFPVYAVLLRWWMSTESLVIFFPFLYVTRIQSLTPFVSLSGENSSNVKGADTSCPLISSLSINISAGTNKSAIPLAPDVAFT